MYLKTWQAVKLLLSTPELLWLLCHKGRLFGHSLYCPTYFSLNLIDVLIIKCALHISDFLNGPSSELL